MNSFSPSKNPPAAVWKVSLRMLGILLLSFLFMPEGWGQGNDLDVSNTSQIPSNAGIVVLTYADDGSWQYQVKDGGQAPQSFSGTLTTGHATGSDPFTAGFDFIIKKADEGQTNTGELTLTDFHFSGKVTVTAAVALYLADKAVVSSGFDARVVLASPGKEAISVETTSSDLLGSSFLEWRFETSPASGSTLVLTEAGTPLGDPFVFPLDGNNKNFAVNAYLPSCHSELMLNNMRLMGKKPGTNDYTDLFEIDGRGKEFVIYEEVAERMGVSDLDEFKNVLQDDLLFEWIRFEADIAYRPRRPSPSRIRSV